MRDLLVAGGGPVGLATALYAARSGLDVTVREDLSSLVRPLDAAPLERYRALAGADGAAYPVLRVSGGAGRAEQVDGVAAAVEERAAVAHEPLEVGTKAGVDRRGGGGDDAARTGEGHEERPGTRKSKSQPSSACSTVR